MNDVVVKPIHPLLIAFNIAKSILAVLAIGMFALCVALLHFYHFGNCAQGNVDYTEFTPPFESAYSLRIQCPAVLADYTARHE